MFQQEVGGTLLQQNLAKNWKDNRHLLWSKLYDYVELAQWYYWKNKPLGWKCYHMVAKKELIVPQPTLDFHSSANLKRLVLPHIFMWRQFHFSLKGMYFLRINFVKEPINPNSESIISSSLQLVHSESFDELYYLDRCYSTFASM